MRDAQATTIYLKDYQVPAFLIERTELRFELGETETRVVSRLQMRRNPELLAQNQSAPADSLCLDGQDMQLVALSLNGEVLSASQYEVADESLTISGLVTLLGDASDFELSCETLIKPQDNTSLEGLYKSHTMFCTQCEAEGFRKITYYLDRPDVMSIFVTTIVADKTRYPVLLSNGNDIERGELDDGRHLSSADLFYANCFVCNPVRSSR